MQKKVLAGSLLAFTVFAAGCGGGSDSPSSAPSNPSTPPTSTPTSPPAGAAKVAGPLDAVQDPVSQDVIGQLAFAFADTPLQGVAQCVDQIVVTDAIDVLDVLANAMQDENFASDPEAGFTDAAAGVQAQVENIVIDLQGMLSALDGNTSSCLGNVNVAPNGGNPLAGTPLEPVGAALAPVLDQVYDQLHGTSGPRPELSLTTIASIVAQLEFALNTAISQLPADVANAPVVGAALSTVQTTVGNLSDTIVAASTSDVEDTQAAIGNTLNDALSGVLLGVVPVSTIENQAGEAGMLSGPIQDAIDDISNEVSGNLGVVLTHVLTGNLDELAGPLSTTVKDNILVALTGPLMEALDNTGSLPTNPLGPIVDTLDTFFSGVEGSPLDLILDLVSEGSGCTAEGGLLGGVLCGIL